MVATAAFAAAQLAALGWAAPAHAVSPTFFTPVYAGDFPDPSILLVGGTYWAYATGSAGRHLQVMSSSDLHSWSAPADPLPVLPHWASAGGTWAPAVIAAGERFVMYYTVQDPALGMECLSVATSVAPGLPFLDQSTGPLMCQAAEGGSIDPSTYLDPSSGHRYLMWKSEDNRMGRDTHIWGEELASDGLQFQLGTSPALLLTQSAAWESPRMEGPTVVRNGPTYYLFFGANGFNTARSGIGYATSGAVLGAYRNQSRAGPWLHTVGRAEGPQGPMVFEDASGRTRLAFAAWKGPVGYQDGGVRALWIGTLGFSRSGGPPTLS